MVEIRKISVVTILDKGTRFYMTALKSFIYQTYQNTEWLIIDNTGRGMIHSKMAPYLEKYEKIKIKTNATVLGKQDVLKQAFELAQGEYIAFFDPKDYWVKDKIARQTAIMMRYNAPLSHTGYAFADDKCHLLPIGCYHVQSELNMLNYTLKNPVSASTVMIKSNLLLDFAQYEDNDKGDLMSFILKNGIVSMGLSDVLTLCRPVFDKEVQSKIEKMIQQVLLENPKDQNVALRVLEHHAHSALNVMDLKLDPTVCIDHDVIASLSKLRNFKI